MPENPVNSARADSRSSPVMAVRTDFEGVLRCGARSDTVEPAGGLQYRPAVFYSNAEQKKIAEAYIKPLDDAHAFKSKIVTLVVPLQAFYMAEEHHQNYCNRNPRNPYVRAVAMPKVDKVAEKVPELMEEEVEPCGVFAQSRMASRLTGRFMKRTLPRLGSCGAGFAPTSLGCRRPLSTLQLLRQLRGRFSRLARRTPDPQRAPSPDPLLETLARLGGSLRPWRENTPQRTTHASRTDSATRSILALVCNPRPPRTP